MSSYRANLREILVMTFGKHPLTTVLSLVSHTTGCTRTCLIISMYEYVSGWRLRVKVRPSEIEYFKIGAHNPYCEDLIKLNPRMSSFSFFKLEDV